MQKGGNGGYCPIGHVHSGEMHPNYCASLVAGWVGRVSAPWRINHAGGSGTRSECSTCDGPPVHGCSAMGNAMVDVAMVNSSAAGSSTVLGEGVG
jgi:hypothetical protein